MSVKDSVRITHLERQFAALEERVATIETVLGIVKENEDKLFSRLVNVERTLRPVDKGGRPRKNGSKPPSEAAHA